MKAMDARLWLLLLALFALVGCAETVDSAESSAIPLPVAMKLFRKSPAASFNIPAVFVFDDSRNCVAKASGRLIYSDDFMEQVRGREVVCNDVSLSAIEKETGFSYSSEVDILFVILTDSGGNCTACDPIIAEFKSAVLDKIESAHVVHTIDIGMNAWFSGTD